MSDTKLISPLLDGFTLGNPMSSRSGVRCYPAIKENSDKKYIVKAVSIPASQVQLDALLLTGAYTDPAAAMDYFKELADGITAEAEILQKLSRLEGFLPYEGWQVEPMENGQLGYRVFLVSSFKRTLEKHMRRNLMTHLQAINLGLDLCAALAISRRAGYMYVDLKPSNIFISGEKEYRIGDLGFVKLDSLKFTSLPEKYVSRYSAPELHDAMNPLNETADTYALGMLLYQIYNDGNLPFRDKAPAEELPTPCNADYELAQIILQAIHPDAGQRWADPLEMGKALAAYLQRNKVNNDPISTPAVPVLEPEIEPVEPEAVNSVQPPETAAEEISQSAEVEPEPPEQTAAAEPEPEKIPAAVAAPAVPASPAVPDPSIQEEEDDLFNFDLEGIDLRDYDTIAQENQPPQEEAVQAYSDPIDDSEVGLTDRKKRWLGPVILVLILALLAGAGFWFYENHYLKTIDSMQVEGDLDELVVLLDTDADNALLRVSCTDTYGNTLSMPVENGRAVFTNLKPGTQYRLDVQIDGFHGLNGFTSQYFTTSNLTNIVSFTAVTGAEDGSVLLTFTVEGADNEEWVVTYGTDGEDYRAESFTGHSVTLRDLTVGKTYTFTLQSSQGLDVTGLTEISFTASRLVLASALHVVSCVDGNLTVRWTGPEDVAVPFWTVRCFTEDGDQQMVTTDKTEATVPSIDISKSYTIEVIAEGMTQAARANITANPLTINEITVNDEDPQALTVSWDYEGTAPEGGWLVMYSIDGSDYQNVVKSDTASCVISPRVHGATYDIEIRAANGISIFDNALTYQSPNAEIFNQYNLPAEKISANLLVTPDSEEWTYRDVSKEDFTSSFTLGQSISILLKADKEFSFPREDVGILYVIRDDSSRVVSELIGQDSMNWWDMWVDDDHHYCELDLPYVPTQPGSYTLALYFNGYAIMAIEFTVSE